MKKQIKTLMILSVLIIVLIAAYVGIRLWNASAEEREAQESEAVVIYLAQMEDISEVSFMYEGETLAFTKDADGSWSYVGDPDFPLDDSFITSIETALASLTAERSFENAEGYEAYGLDEPALTLSATASEDTALTLFIGEQSGSSSGYYAYREGDDKLYTVSSDLPGLISYHLLDLVELDTFPALDEAKIETVSLESEGGNINLKKEAETYEVESEADSGETNEDGEVIMETVLQEVTGYTWYLETGNGWEMIDNENSTVTSLVSEISALSFDSCVDYSAEETDLDPYSLDNPQYTLTITYDGGQELILYLGGLDDSGYYYSGLGDSSAVNLLNPALLETTLNLNESTLMEDNVSN